MSLLTKQLMTGGDQSSLKTKILGKEVSLPFGFAPCAMHKLAHPQG
jgi:isopentenyl diphosphate isomerase/L-lactate dehydrogenase-like FMN-dependent dehydrogenase